MAPVASMCASVPGCAAPENTDTFYAVTPGDYTQLRGGSSSGQGARMMKSVIAHRGQLRGQLVCIVGLRGVDVDARGLVRLRLPACQPTRDLGVAVHLRCLDAVLELNLRSPARVGLMGNPGGAAARTL